MAYTSQSTPSTYNQSPPADDGTVSTANQVFWSTIKTKLSDPLNTFCANINTAVSSEFTALGQGGTITAGTADSGTGSETSLEFTSIPSWVKKITFMISGLSTDGTSIPILQIGDSGGYEVTSYLGATGAQVAASSYATTNNSDGFNLAGGTHAGSVVFHGTVTLTNITSNTWVAAISMGRSDTATVIFGGGSKALSATLDRVRITTQGGSDNFDTGTVNILYE